MIRKDAMFTPEEVERIEDEYDHRVQVAVDLIWLGFVAGVILGIVIGLVIVDLIRQHTTVGPPMTDFYVMGQALGHAVNAIR